MIVNEVGWLGNRMVSVLDSGAEGPGFKSQPRRCRSLRQTVHTHRASVHQAAKLIAVLLRISGVTAGLVESNSSLAPGLWLTTPAGRLPRTGISSGTLRSVIEYGLPFLLIIVTLSRKRHRGRDVPVKPGVQRQVACPGCVVVLHWPSLWQVNTAQTSISFSHSTPSPTHSKPSYRSYSLTSRLQNSEWNIRWYV